MARGSAYFRVCGAWCARAPTEDSSNSARVRDEDRTQGNGQENLYFYLDLYLHYMGFGWVPTPKCRRLAVHHGVQLCTEHRPPTTEEGGARTEHRFTDAPTTEDRPPRSEASLRCETCCLSFMGTLDAHLPRFGPIAHTYIFLVLGKHVEVHRYARWCRSHLPRFFVHSPETNEIRVALLTQITYTIHGLVASLGWTHDT